MKQAFLAFFLGVWRECLAAVSLTVVAESQTCKIVDVVASADADTSATITHNFGVAPREALIENLLNAIAAASDWAVTTRSTTQVVLTKSTAVGSGNAGAQIRVHIKIPHTVGA